MSSGRVGKAIVLTCFFTARYGRHRKFGVGFRTAGYGRTWVNGLNTFSNHSMVFNQLCLIQFFLTFLQKINFPWVKKKNSGYEELFSMNFIWPVATCYKNFAQKLIIDFHTRLGGFAWCQFQKIINKLSTIQGVEVFLVLSEIELVL